MTYQLPISSLLGLDQHKTCGFLGICRFVKIFGVDCGQRLKNSILCKLVFLTLSNLLSYLDKCGGCVVQAGVEPLDGVDHAGVINQAGEGDMDEEIH